MAKGTKKKETLTPEEKLRQALVPVEEQEYILPSNWNWIILGNMVSIKRGASPRPIKSYVTGNDCGINWIKIGDADDGKYIRHIKEKITEEGARKSVFVEKGTLLLSNSMSFGHPYILDVNGCIHDGWLAITPGEAFNKEYLYYALLSSDWYFERVAVGTAVRNLNSDRVASTPIPLPPLPEQQRIVARIESLFAKLDEVKEKAQAVVDGYEDRKAAILHKAFTGELTAKWREEKGISISSWKEVSIGEVLMSVKDKYDPIQGKKLNKPYIGLEHIEKGKGIVKKGNSTDVKSLKTLFSAGDLLYGKLRPYLDKHDIASFDGLCSTDILVYRAKGNNSARFVNYLMGKTEFIEYANSRSKGINLPRTSEKEISSYRFQLPTSDEQKRIVQIIDELMNTEADVRYAARSVLDQIDTMKKSILARAFRGELGTNDPADEPAVKLLKKVLEEEK